MGKRLIDADALIAESSLISGTPPTWNNPLGVGCVYGVTVDTIENAPTVDATEEPDILKFYYCESEDDYFIGRRVDNFYYARFDKNTKRFAWQMSRDLPWGQRVVNEKTLWKEHTYPSEPVELEFNEWLMGFIGKYGIYLT